MNALAIQLAGEALIADAARALYWPAQASLLVADVHLGKGALLRRAGIALPSGDTQANLDRLDGLIERYRPQRLLVLGDLVHGRAGEHSAWVAQTASWRARHPQLAMELIGGNHDRQVDVEQLGFRRLPEELPLGPFLLSHHPRQIAGHYVLAGHIHPGIVVRDGWRQHRLPAFRFGSGLGVLPAFGSLTGLQIEPVQAGERCLAITPVGLLDLGGDDAD